MSYIPSVRAQTLARRLAKLREEAGYSITQAAAMLGWSRAKLGHIETGRTRPKPDAVRRILDVYGVTSPERDALIALAEQAETRGWWTAYRDLLDGPYVALEDAAATISQWSPLVVPGLLQTTDYARALLASVGEETDVERALRARANRQLVLRRGKDAPHLHVVLEESVLHRQVGGPDVMRDQLYHLAAEADRPNVTIQLLPMSTGAHPGLEGPFVLFSFAGPMQPDVAYSEGVHGVVYLEDAAKVRRCRLAFEALKHMALGPDETAEQLRTVAKQ